VSRYLLPHIIRILTFVLQSFYNNFILKHLRNIPFELPPHRSRYFHTSILPNVYLKIKINYQKFVLYDNILVRYNLTIHTVWFLPSSSSQDKIDLARVLTVLKVLRYNLHYEKKTCMLLDEKISITSINICKMKICPMKYSPPRLLSNDIERKQIFYKKITFMLSSNPQKTIVFSSLL
jgi:hypothetical protein